MFTPIEYITTTCYSMPVKFPSLYLTNYDNILSNVFETLRSAVKKRVQNTEREVLVYCLEVWIVVLLRLWLNLCIRVIYIRGVLDLKEVKI